MANRKNKMTEKELEKKIILNLKLHGCEVAKSGESSWYNSHYLMAGMSDLIVFIPGGGIIFMEVKAPRGKQRDSQKMFGALCVKCKLKYVIVRSVKESMDAVRTVIPG